MNRDPDIRKAAGIIIKDRRLLVVRQKDKDFFISPGGKLDGLETSVQALVRELKEEISLAVLEKDLEFFGSFFANAVGAEDKLLQMDVFIVKHWEGETKLNPTDKVEEFRWVASTEAKSINLGSIFQHDVIPKLKELDLIN